MTDAKLLFSNDQAITSTADSTSTLDIGALTDDRGNALSEMGPENQKIMLDVLVTTLFGGQGSTTLTFKLQDSTDDSTFADTEITSAALDEGVLVAGYRVFRIALPPTVKRYLKMVYTIGSGPMTVGKVHASLRFGTQT